MMTHYQEKHLNNIEPLGLDQMVVNFNALDELAIHWCVVHCWLVMFGINGHPVPSSANSRFMEMLNKKDLIWELMFYYNPQFLHIGHFHYNVWKFPCNTVIVNRHITLWFSAIKWMCKQCKGLFLCDNLYFNKGDNSTLSVFQCALLHISSIYDTSLGRSISNGIFFFTHSFI
jgi:hypothetical protein